jgi:hypothetical protein
MGAYSFCYNLIILEIISLQIWDEMILPFLNPKRRESCREIKMSVTYFAYYDPKAKLKNDYHKQNVCLCVN